MSVSHSHPAGTHAHPELGFLRKYIFSEDHKIIGIQFLFSGLIFLVHRRHPGPAGAHPARLAARGPSRSSASWFPAAGAAACRRTFYNMLFSMHASVMIFFVIIPLLTGAFGNFPIPLMIGARDMAFPKLNMMSYWFMWPAFVVILASFFVDGGAAGVRLDLVSDARQRHHAAPGEGFESPAAPHSGIGQILLAASPCSSSASPR